MDLSKSIQARSDQINADDLVATGPVDVTITGVTNGKAEQPFDFQVAEFPGRAYRPGVTMRRVIVKAWGPDSDNYIGKRLRLYCDPTVHFGKETVGGVRISHMSGIPKRMTFPVTVTRGRRQPYTVDPLPDAPHSAPAITPEDVASCTSVEELRVMWQAASPDVQQLIKQRVAEIQGQVTQMPAPEADGGDAA